MNYVKFNEWSEMGLKKDIEKISKKMDSNEPVFLSICFEIVITVGVVLIDHLFDAQNIPIIAWIITAIVALIPPIIALIASVKRFISRVISVKNGQLKTIDYIDTFDNSICYWAMISRSFCNLLKKDRDNLSNDEKMFYYQEANYYIYKSILKLDEMRPISNKIFANPDDNTVGKHIITLERLETIINLLKNATIELETEASYINGYNNAKNRQIDIINEYRKIINSFLDNLNEIYSYNFTRL